MAIPEVQSTDSSLYIPDSGAREKVDQGIAASSTDVENTSNEREAETLLDVIEITLRYAYDIIFQLRGLTISIGGDSVADQK